MTPTDTAAPPGATLTSTQSTGSGGALMRSAASDISAGVFSGIAAFEAAQRMAQCLCSSTMVPTEYRGQQGLANSLIALEIAGRMGLSPLVVMQNMTPIHGRPSWSSSFLIATVNASGRFTPLRFHFDDEESPSWCYAEASDRSSGESLKGEKISIAMAKREGWWSRKDRHGNESSKWQSMTGQMLRYRAASFWVRVFCPEISLGLITQDEAIDANAPAAVVQAVTVREVEANKSGAAAGAVPQPIRAMPAPAPASSPQAEESSEPATVLEVEPAAEPPAEATSRARRSNGRPRRSAPAAEEAAEHSPTATRGESEPDRDAAAEQTKTPEPPQTSELTEHQSLLHARVSRTEDTTEAELVSAPAPAPTPNPTAAAPTAELATVAATSAPITEQSADPTSLSAADVVQTGLREIPRLTNLEALEGARSRVNRLLASGRIHEDGAEQLWAVIDRRVQQLQVNRSGEVTP